MAEILTREYPLTISDIDCHKLCKLSALLNYIQNIATDHGNALGVGGDVMAAEYGAVWMMARVCIRLFRPIAHGDELRITTWHRSADKTPIVNRDIDIFVGEKHVGEAVIAWVIVDLAERKLVKPLSLPCVVNSLRPSTVKDITPAKLKPPEHMAQEFVRVVRYSDTDINGHMNNTKYVDIACDAIQYDRFIGKFISEAQINYLHECFPGEELIIFRGEQDGCEYVRGTDSNGKARFDVSLKIEDIV